MGTHLDAIGFEAQGVHFRFTPLTLKPARRFWTEFIKRFGPGLAEGARGKDDMSIKELIVGMLDGLDPDFHESAVELFLANVMVNMAGKGPYKGWVPLIGDPSEMLFARALTFEIEVLIECLEGQYGDFLEFLKSRPADAANDSGSKSPEGSLSPSALTGNSTESPPASSMGQTG